MKNTLKFTNLVTSVVMLMFLLPCACRSADYDMQTYCGRTLSLSRQNGHQLNLSLDDSYTYNGRTCPTTVILGTYSHNYHRIMFYFDKLNLNCNSGNLLFFENKGKIYGLEQDLCASAKPEGVFTADRVDIYFHRNSWQTGSYAITIIFTAYGSAPCTSDQYECDNSRCIDSDIAHNEYNSCGYGSGNFKTPSPLIIGAAIGFVLFYKGVVSF